MVDESLNAYMYQFIERVCNDVGPRESGTEQELTAGDMVEEELKNYCDTAYQEEYVSSPHAFLGGIKYGTISVLITILLYWLDLSIDLNLLPLDKIYGFSFLIISVILIIICLSYFILEVMKYYEAFDFLFPKRKSRNIIGKIEPTDEVTQTIIFSAHHDSAFEFNTFYYLKRLGQIIINVGYIAVVIVLIVLILKLIFFFLSLELTLLFVIFGIVFIFFIPIFLVYIMFHTYKPVLGAFDNLSGVAIVLGIGRYLRENKSNAAIFPKHTKVYLISFAGEEAGLRGSKRYVTKHLDELRSEKVKVVNMDAIAKKDIIIIHDKESGIGAKHDPEIYNALMDISNRKNLNARLMPLPFGATDASAFSKKKISAVAIGGLNLKEQLPDYYHTRKDTPEVIESQALGQIVDLCIEYLKEIDSQ